MSLKLAPAAPKPAAPKMATKTSVGVILCRINPATLRPEVLLVHKRYTYAFIEFVLGQYTRGGEHATMRPLTTLLENMTTDELIDIWSLNFEQIWYRAWLTNGRGVSFAKKSAKFSYNFLQDDSGAGLRSLVEAAIRTTHGTLLWEVPKGRRQYNRESDAICAIRELEEETGIQKSEYRILPGVRRAQRFVSDGVCYDCTYYVAVANPRLAASPACPLVKDLADMHEVSEVRWHDIERIRMLEGSSPQLEALVAPAFTLAKKYYRGRWGHRVLSRA